MQRPRFVVAILSIPVAFFALVALLPPRAAAGETAARPAPATATLAPVQAAPAPLGPMEYDRTRGAWVAPLGDTKAVLTIDPRLQERLEQVLLKARAPAAAVVLLEPRTGRVLALAESSREPGRRGLALRALAPAASVFKIVTSSALLGAGVSPDSETCFHGGKHRLQPGLLRDDPRRDRRCYSLSSALGHSANVVFAKLARGLTAPALRSEAE